MDPHPLDYKTPPPPPPKGNPWRAPLVIVMTIGVTMLFLVILLFVYLFVGIKFGWIEP